MTASDVAVWILLPLGVIVQMAGVVGVLVMPNVLDRLHYLGPASGMGPILIAAAVVAREAFDHQGIEAVLIAGFLAVFGAVLTHVTGRAARLRAHHDWRIQPGEGVKGP